jgi:hypothetical protein
VRIAVSAPDGTSWTVRRVAAPWRLRHRAGFAPDLAGVVIWLLGWLVLFVEGTVWTVCWVVMRVGHVLGRPWVVEATTPAPPGRVLSWSVAGSAASLLLTSEIATGLAEGRDVAATAATRVVGDDRPHW